MLCRGLPRARVNERRESLAKVTGELIKNKTLGSSDLLPRERERERGGERGREREKGGKERCIQIWFVLPGSDDGCADDDGRADDTGSGRDHRRTAFDAVYNNNNDNNNDDDYQTPRGSQLHLHRGQMSMSRR